MFLCGAVLLLAFLSCWQLDLSGKYYRVPRWEGVWDSPNTYGMLMSAGLVLAAGLMAAERARRGRSLARLPPNAEMVEHPNRFVLPFAFCRSPRGWFGAPAHLAADCAAVLPIFLIVALLIMWIGLLFSYSRGAWLGTAVGFAYLARSYGKLKWRHVMPGVGLVTLCALVLWGRTPDSAPWYIKRMDFGRPSAQHRISAWRGALHIMWEHPLGVGWDRAVDIYGINYSPPGGGAGAIATNDYMMLGTQLGWPGLASFVGYVGLALKGDRRWKLGRKNAECRILNEETKADTAEQSNSRTWKSENSRATLDCEQETPDLTKVACRSTALAMLVAFWFDGGLFTLATASVFWVVLELGKETENRRWKMRRTYAEGRMEDEERKA
jgi:O-antigen ligase